MDDDENATDLRMGQKGFECPRQNGLPEERTVLLGKAFSGSGAASGGDDECGN